MNRSLLAPWTLRIMWGTLPLTVGPALGDALDERSLLVARTASGLAWAVWAAGLLVVAIPRTVGLTAIRAGAPLVACVAGWAAVEVGDAAGVVAVTAAAVMVLATFAPTTGDWLVNGSSYGDERRMPLRPPAAVLFGPLELVWLLTVAPPVLGALLLAARNWLPGAVVLVVWALACRSLASILHGLSRRWVVFVPAGIVLHDHLAMLDPVLFPRSALARLGPAPADAVTEDLTGGALGLALQLDLRSTLQVAPRRGREEATPIDVESVRFTPTRPGALLAEARVRRLPVG